MPKTELRKASREHRPTIEHKEGYTLTIDQLNAGSLLRIADAMEVVAKERVDLQQQLQFWKQHAEVLEATRKRLNNTIRAMKGQITRLKKTKQ